VGILILKTIGIGAVSNHYCYMNSIFFADIINSEVYVSDILHPVLAV
jgi:hypothetical protein